jgi:hypothetical protein
LDDTENRVAIQDNKNKRIFDRFKNWWGMNF